MDNRTNQYGVFLPILLGLILLGGLIDAAYRIFVPVSQPPATASSDNEWVLYSHRTPTDLVVTSNIVTQGYRTADVMYTGTGEATATIHLFGNEEIEIIAPTKDPTSTTFAGIPIQSPDGGCKWGSEPGNSGLCSPNPVPLPAPTSTNLYLGNIQFEGTNTSTMETYTFFDEENICDANKHCFVINSPTSTPL